MIIDLSLLASGRAFVWVIMAVKGRLVCPSLNQLLLVCHHVQGGHVAAASEDINDQETGRLALKDSDWDLKTQWVYFRTK